MIELAPNHKVGLSLNSPLIAGGVFGFSDEYASLVDFSKFGAFITNPITLAPRFPAREQQVIQFEGGALIHSGLPNAGLSAVLAENKNKWARLGCPVIVHLAASDSSEMTKCVDKLERIESVSAIEVGFRDDEELPIAESILRAAVESNKPLIVQLPHDRAVAFARLSEKVGAQVIAVSAPPRGTMLKEGEQVEGRLYGVAVLPRVLQIIREIKTQTSLPIIGAGGVHTQDDVALMLEAGAMAAQVDSVVWANPSSLFA